MLLMFLVSAVSCTRTYDNKATDYNQKFIGSWTGVDGSDRGIFDFRPKGEVVFTVVDYMSYKGTYQVVIEQHRITVEVHLKQNDEVVMLIGEFNNDNELVLSREGYGPITVRKIEQKESSNKAMDSDKK